MFENIREDWQTYERDWARQGLWVMLVYRFGRWRYGIENRVLRWPFSFLYKLLKVLSQIMTGIDLPCEVGLGRRFLIEHFGGIIISGDAVFGDDCVVRNGVTVGLRHRGVRGAPMIGDRVDIGAGAKVLGPIRIGNDVAIGANAVVIQDVPDGCLAVGVPARIISRGEATSARAAAGAEASSGTDSRSGAGVPTS
jgi:serine O-acetyltransferase